jgi:hypothetical protein
VLFHIFPERSGEVKGEAESGMAGEDLEERAVAFVESGPDDEVEVPDRLVVMDGE